jgi:uncharacterized protein YegL
MRKQLLSLLISTSMLLTALPAWANLDVVFLLDTTGSMASEIREVKERVVQLSRTLEDSRKGETVRFGVVAYRDRGDAYLTRLSPLSGDVEQSERFLGLLMADGGGDGPEDVLSGLRDALSKMKWTMGKATERQIFLVGDAPPHLDYADGPRPEALIELARRKRIVINAIGCRSLSVEGIHFFRELAYATEGSYQHIGRVHGEKRGVADAMLKSLMSDAADMDLTGAQPVALQPLTMRDGKSDSDVVLVRPERIDSDAKKHCGVSIHWPANLMPASVPKVLNHDGSLVFVLDTKPGMGKTEWYQFEDCRFARAPIQVRMGGAR